MTKHALTLTAFRETRTFHRPDYIGFPQWPENGDVSAEVAYAGDTGFQALANGSFFLEVQTYDWTTRDLADAEARLFFHFYVAEIVPADAWNLHDLSMLLDEWCEWRDFIPNSASEMLLDAYAGVSGYDPEDVYFLDWFCRTWEAAESAGDRIGAAHRKALIPADGSLISTP